MRTLSLVIVGLLTVVVLAAPPSSAQGDRAGGQSGSNQDSNEGTAWTIRQNYFQRYKFAAVFGPSSYGAPRKYSSGDIIKKGESVGPGKVRTKGPVFKWPKKIEGPVESEVPTKRDEGIMEYQVETFGYPVSDTQFQMIQRLNDNMMLEEAFDPERWMWMENAMGIIKATSAANSVANLGRNQAAGAIDHVERYLTNFTAEAGNVWNKIRDQLFVPMAVLLLLPGAVLSQVRAIVAAGTPIFGEVNPFEGILRSIVAIFLIPATYLVVNYGIDVSNAITKAISDGYESIFHSNMYRDAFCAQKRALPIRNKRKNDNQLPASSSSGNPANSSSDDPFAQLESISFDIGADENCDQSSGGNSFPAGSARGERGGSLSADGGAGQNRFAQAFDDAASYFGFQRGSRREPTMQGVIDAAGRSGGQNDAQREAIANAFQSDRSGGNGSGGQGGQGRGSDETDPVLKSTQRLVVGAANAGLTGSWNVLCAFQMAYLYYLFCIGPVVAALWVWPMQQLRQALPSWVEGVVTLCFWSLFWNTTVLLMAAFKGVGETGTVIMTALNFLAVSSVKYAFDFAGLVKAAGEQAGKEASKGLSSGGGKAAQESSGGHASAGRQFPGGAREGSAAGSAGEAGHGGQSGAGGSAGGANGAGDGLATAAAQSLQDAMSTAAGASAGDGHRGLSAGHTLPPPQDGGGGRSGDTAGGEGGGSAGSGYASGDAGPSAPPLTSGAGDGGLGGTQSTAGPTPGLAGSTGAADLAAGTGVGGDQGASGGLGGAQASSVLDGGLSSAVPSSAGVTDGGQIADVAGGSSAGAPAAAFGGGVASGSDVSQSRVGAEGGAVSGGSPLAGAGGSASQLATGVDTGASGLTSGVGGGAAAGAAGSSSVGGAVSGAGAASGFAGGGAVTAGTFAETGAAAGVSALTGVAGTASAAGTIAAGNASALSAGVQPADSISGALSGLPPGAADATLTPPASGGATTGYGVHGAGSSSDPTAYGSGLTAASASMVNAVVPGDPCDPSTAPNIPGTPGNGYAQQSVTHSGHVAEGGGHVGQGQGPIAGPGPDAPVAGPVSTASHGTVGATYGAGGGGGSPGAYGSVTGVYGTSPTGAGQLDAPVQNQPLSYGGERGAAEGYVSVQPYSGSGSYGSNYQSVADNPSYVAPASGSSGFYSSAPAQYQGDYAGGAAAGGSAPVAAQQPAAEPQYAPPVQGAASGYGAAPSADVCGTAGGGASSGATGGGYYEAAGSGNYSAAAGTHATPIAENPHAAAQGGYTNAVYHSTADASPGGGAYSAAPAYFTQAAPPEGYYVQHQGYGQAAANHAPGPAPSVEPAQAQAAPAASAGDGYYYRSVSHDAGSYCAEAQSVPAAYHDASPQAHQAPAQPAVDSYYARASHSAESVAPVPPLVPRAASGGLLGAALGRAASPRPGSAAKPADSAQAGKAGEQSGARHVDGSLMEQMGPNRKAVRKRQQQPDDEGQMPWERQSE